MNSTPAGFVYGALRLVLRRMMAGNPHDCTACPEIADSPDIDSTRKALLLDLRERMLSGPFAAHRLANDAGTRIRFGVLLREVIGKLSPDPAPPAPAEAREVGSPGWGISRCGGFPVSTPDFGIALAGHWKRSPSPPRSGRV